MADGRDKSAPKKIALAASCLLIVIALSAAIFTTGKNQDSYLTLSGLNKNDVIKVRLDQRGKAETLVPSSTKDDSRYARPENVNGSYSLTATAQSGGKHKDVVFFVDQTKNTVFVTASGFPPKETLDVRQGDQKIHNDLHFDWAGRIVITHDFSDAKSEPFCLKTESGFSVCHELPNGGHA